MYLPEDVVLYGKQEEGTDIIKSTFLEPALKTPALSYYRQQFCPNRRLIVYIFFPLSCFMCLKYGQLQWTLFSDLSDISSAHFMDSGYLCTVYCMSILILVHMAELKLKMLVQSKATDYLNRPDVVLQTSIFE